MKKAGRLSISEIIDSYEDFVCRLNSVLKYFDGIEDLSFCNRNGEFSEELECLNKARIRDVLEKIKYSSLLYKLKDKHKELFLNTILSVGFSKMGGDHGLMEFKEKIPLEFDFGSFYIGAQVQGIQLRLFAEVMATDNKKTKIKKPENLDKVLESIVLNLIDKKIWIVLPDTINVENMREPGTKLKFNKFSSLFLFRYKNLNYNTTFCQIIECFAELKEYI